MMNKRYLLFICFVLMICMAAGCKKDKIKEGSNQISSVPTEEAEQTKLQDTSPASEEYADSLRGTMTKENFPIIDGSTATIPISEAVYQLATGATAEEAASDIVHTKTSNSYYRLMNKEADLLIVYAPSEQVLADIKKGGNRLDIKPIGKDALVFMANTSNPVESLTKEQLVDIYSGKITNWSELGGPDKEILAFQRPENSGSQTLMLKLVMGETPMMMGPNVISYESMEGILEAMADYSNEGNTLGYSVYYYAQNMYQLPELRFMKVDGVEPSLQSIYDNSYPYINEFYAVIRKDEPLDSNAHKIFDWLTEEEGQMLIKDLGYVPISMDIAEETNQMTLLKEDVIPEGYCYVAASYNGDSGITSGTVTIYKGHWESVRVLQNAYIGQNKGLIPEDEKLCIGYATDQEQGEFSMSYGLYDLKKNDFAIPAKYSSIFVLDEEKGYYVVEDEGGVYNLLDRNGKTLISDFMYGEGFGITKEGDYYWLYQYNWETNEELYTIYDANLEPVKNITRNYFNGELYNADGSLYFSKEMFMNKYGFTETPEDEFYASSYNVGEALFSIDYNGNSYVLNRDLDILSQIDHNTGSATYYNVYYDIFSVSQYNYETYTETGLFYDIEGKLIVDEEGNSYTNIVSTNYWRGNDSDELEQILYGVTDHILRLYDYRNKTFMKIDLGDWQNINIEYVNQDMVVVHKIDGEQRTRVYKDGRLISDKKGLYYLAYNPNNYKQDYFLLTCYGNTGTENYHILYSNQGEILYESKSSENIISIDEYYIQLERGNYWGVMDHKGDYIIRRIKNSLSND